MVEMTFKVECVETNKPHAEVRKSDAEKVRVRGRIATEGQRAEGEIRARRGGSLIACNYERIISAAMRVRGLAK